jgi:hypothetical protein
MKYIFAAGSQASEARTTIMNCVFSCQGLSPMNVRYLYAAILIPPGEPVCVVRTREHRFVLPEAATQRLSG